MPHRILVRSCLWLLVALMVGFAGCGRSETPNESASAAPVPPRNEIPADKLDAVLTGHLAGLGAMEQYEYAPAVAAFQKVHELAPGWIPGSINLAIALLNKAGNQAEAAKSSGGGGNSNASFDDALTLLDDVIQREPENLNAHYCRGLILEFLGQNRTADAHKDFQFVVDHDPSDGHAWFKLGATLASTRNPEQPAGPDQADRLIEIYSRALECNPNLVTALYKLQQAYSWARKPEKQKEVSARWRQLNPKNNPAGPGDTAEAFYGESGKYARIINPFPPLKAKQESGPPPHFDAPDPIKVALAEGERWVTHDDLQGPLAFLGRARSRFGATVATLDADGDGKTDLFLAAAIKGPHGVRDALLLNRGDGVFEDVSKSWGVPEDRASLGVAAADFDADRRIDLFLTGSAGYHLLRNQAGKGFEDVTEKAGIPPSVALGLTARWLDIDQDGDLDLFVVNHTQLDAADRAFSSVTVPGAVNVLYRNVGKPPAVKGRPEDNWAPLANAPPDLPATEGLTIAFAPWPDAETWLGPPANYSALAAADFDDDRDLDLIVSSDDQPARILLNDRLGAFHAQELRDVERHPVSGLFVTDLDKDGHADLGITQSDGRVDLLRNTTDLLKSPRVVAFDGWPTNANRWTTAVATDIDLDTWPDLVGLSAVGERPIEWAHNARERLEASVLPLGPASDALGAARGLALADLAADPLLDVLIVEDGAPPRVARNLGNGLNWLALDLGGRWKTSFDHMRTNPHGLGARITLEGQELHVTYDHTTNAAGLAQSVGPIVLGLGNNPSAELVRLRWPDGTMQCELNQKVNTRVALAEYNRKQGSCPVLFTWNGTRFVCLGDFLGGGGLGYLVAPGVYSQPDRDESVGIRGDQLQPVNGVFRLSVTEPMDEVAYLDRLTLHVVDSPPGVTTTPDERFAPEGPRPTGASIAWKQTVTPVRATSLTGRDVSTELAAWDRRTVDGFKRLHGWVGYAEAHGIVLDFADRLKDLGPSDHVTLVLAGWVEYPYSQTNYAAATAGIALMPPVLERRNADGTWSIIEPSMGYPAGMPRMMTLDLTGKLTGPSCILRIRTNMECYWDQAFVAIRDVGAEARIRQTELPVARAELGHRGYTREVSPDGRQPLLYDYDYVDPSPMALMQGTLTRHGDVVPLLRNDDDQLCLVGPGDEVRLEFDGSQVPPLPEGWTRSYVLRAIGYCKDADPFTAGSDEVGPLPWRNMPPYPFQTLARRPLDDAYRAYLNEYQTRPAGVR